MFYLLLLNRTVSSEDLKMILLFYGFGLLGHRILIRQIREMEETRPGFYCGMRLSLSDCYLQYECLYFFLFIPEIIMTGWLTPAYLHYQDALLFIFFGYSSLLLMNSLLCLKSFRITDLYSLSACFLACTMPRIGNDFTLHFKKKPLCCRHANSTGASMP